MPTPHTTETCSQGPTLAYIKESIGELKDSSKRTADAFEALAAQGVMVTGVRKDVDRHEKYFEEIFPRLTLLEKKDAKEEGASEIKKEVREVEQRKQNFIDQVKANLVSYIVGAVFLGLYVVDKLNIAQKLSAFWKEMCK